MTWRGLTLAGLLHGFILLAIIVLVRTHLPPAPPEGPVITVVAEAAPQPEAAPAPVSAKPLPPPPPLPPTPPKQEKTAPAPMRREVQTAKPTHSTETRMAARAAPGSQARVPARVGEQNVSVTRPAVADADNAAPVYTIFERELGEQGTVHLQILVLPSGAAGSVTVVKSSGYRILDASAQKAVMGWHFQPALRHGTAVASTVPYSIAFVLQ